MSIELFILLIIFCCSLTCFVSSAVAMSRMKKIAVKPENKDRLEKIGITNKIVIGISAFLMLLCVLYYFLVHRKSSNVSKSSSVMSGPPESPTFPGSSPSLPQPLRSQPPSRTLLSRPSIRLQSSTPSTYLSSQALQSLKPNPPRTTRLLPLSGPPLAGTSRNLLASDRLRVPIVPTPRLPERVPIVPTVRVPERIIDRIQRRPSVDEEERKYDDLPGHSPDPLSYIIEEPLEPQDEHDDLAYLKVGSETEKKPNILGRAWKRIGDFVARNPDRNGLESPQSLRQSILANEDFQSAEEFPPVDPENSPMANDSLEL